MGSETTPEEHDVLKEQDVLKEERWKLLREIDEFTERPLIALSFVWLVLTMVDFTVGLNPVLQALTYVIWALFILDFAIGIVIAPDKLAYMKTNWLTALSLMVPALRVFRLVRVLRFLRFARVVRSLSLFRLVTSLNRGMRALRVALGRRGIGFVVVLSVFVLFAGSAGILFFESPAAIGEEGEQGPGIAGFGDALWWSAMMLTTLGSEYWPQTVEGRFLAFFMALYAFAIFGYVTATIASFFVGKDAAEPAGPVAGAEELSAVRQEVTALRAGSRADRSYRAWRAGAAGCVMHYRRTYCVLRMPCAGARDP